MSNHNNGFTKLLKALKKTGHLLHMKVIQTACRFIKQQKILAGA